MKFENVKVSNFEGALRGMRNPKNSWHLSDSIFGLINCEYDDPAGDEVAANWVDNDGIEFGTEDWDKYLDKYVDWLANNGVLAFDPDQSVAEVAYIGPKDMKLAQSLIKSGPEHRKFLRQIQVCIDITAPLYWWKEFDTYKVGTVANSTSTMHKLTSKPITLDCFEIDGWENIEYPEDAQREDLRHPIDKDFVQMCLIPYLEYLRQTYLETKDYKYWKELVRWLPEAWLQTRTVTMNYENLLAICSKSQRRNHKLKEWSGDKDYEYESFIKFARTLPYAQEFIFIDETLDKA